MVVSFLLNIKLFLLVSEWNSSIPKSLLILITGVIIFGIGIFLRARKYKKKEKQDITKAESKLEQIYRIEDDIDMWGLLITGVLVMILSFIS